MALSDSIKVSCRPRLLRKSYWNIFDSCKQMYFSGNFCAVSSDCDAFMLYFFIGPFSLHRPFSIFPMRIFIRRGGGNNALMEAKWGLQSNEAWRHFHCYSVWGINQDGAVQIDARQKNLQQITGKSCRKKVFLLDNTYS